MSEKLSRYFKQEEEICSHNQKHYWSKAEFEACTGFEPKVITNGDRIRQMSNEELAKFFGCLRHLETCPHAHSDYPCDKCNLDYLNAPADCVAENGESAKQVDLFCKRAKKARGGE